jgi:putative transposase
MPNHFHLVVLPEQDGALSRWMHWVQNTHVRRYHQHHHSSGHVWQGRFRAFPIEQDDHLLTVLRYVERNPLRAKLVTRAEQWAWSSAQYWQEEASRPGWLSAGPVPRPTDWLARVNQPLTVQELEKLRSCLKRGTPYGGATWVERTARRLHLESSLRPRGRPRKNSDSTSKK